jgi:hypothetical protein
MLLTKSDIKVADPLANGLAATTAISKEKKKEKNYKTQKQGNRMQRLITMLSALSCRSTAVASDAGPCRLL